MKTCCRCNKSKIEGDFFRRSDRPDGRQSHCKTCHHNDHYSLKKTRESKLKRRYGISEEIYLKMNEEQKGLCAICKGQNKGRGRISVDHCHTTKLVRGLLCFRCNTMLGSIERVGLLEIIAYLLKYQKRSLSRDQVRAELDTLLSLERIA